MANTATAPKNGVQKTAQTAPPTNGQQATTSQAAPEAKIEKELPPTPLAPTPGKTEQAAPPAKPALSIDEVLLQIEQRAELARKHDKLRNTKAELEFFRLSGEGMRESLLLTDGTHHQFTTSYTPLLQKVHATIDAWVAEQLAAIEAELIASA